MTFLYPFFIGLVFVYILCIVYCKKSHNTTFANTKLLKRFVVKTSYQTFDLLYILALISIVISLMYPVLRNSTITQKRVGYEIAIVLDSSNSMSDNNLFAKAKKIIDRFITNRKGDTIALEVFGNRAYIASPLSCDINATKSILQELYTGVAGSNDTALYEALFLSTKLFDSSSKYGKVVIVVTDGIDTLNNIPPQIVSKELKRLDIKLYLIGIGDDYTKDSLKKFALMSGGEFYSVENIKDLDTIYSHIDSLLPGNIIVQKSVQNRAVYDIFVYLYILFLILIIFKNGICKESILLIFATFFALFALYIYPKATSSNANSSLSIAIDISDSMYADDIKPNRFSIAKIRATEAVKELNIPYLSLIVFTSKPYLISPPTRDKKSILDMLQRLSNEKEISKGTDILSALKGALYIESRFIKRGVLIFSDGGDYLNTKEIKSYIKDNNITLYSWAVATPNGSTIPLKDGDIMEYNHNIITTKLNPNLKSISKFFGIENGNSKSFKEFLDSINSDYNIDSSSKNRLVLIYLFISFILFIYARFGEFND